MPLRMLTLDDVELEGKRVFLRVDINTPVHPETGKLMEQERLEEAAVTIADLSKAGVVVASHQGRVGRSDYIGMAPHAEALEKILGRKVKFVADVMGPSALAEMDSLKDGEVLLRDNLRVTAEEDQEYKPPDAEKSILVSRLSKLVNMSVLDAVSTAHRASPTIVGFAGLMPTCAGRVVGKELRKLDRISAVEKGPFVTVLGGAKVNDRLEAIDALIANNRADKVLLCGLVGMVFLKAAGKLKGETGIDGEQKFVPKAARLLEEDPDRYLIPIDVGVKEGDERKDVDVAELQPGAKVLDIGEKTVEKYARQIKGAGTVFMSGPPGAFEWEEFSRGTEGLLRAMASSLGTTIISGGHLSTALKKYGFIDEIDHVCTAGGALVQYLAGKRLPLIDALERSADKFGNKR